MAANFRHRSARKSTIHGRHLPQELVQEILSYLPATSLMRFKAVCKLWRSIILDPAFPGLHQRLPSGGARKGVLTIFNPLDGTNEKQQDRILNFVLLRFDGGQQISRHQIDFAAHFTNQVHGLACLYGSTCSGANTLPYLHNIATRETLQLPDSTYCSFVRNIVYHLGFDPVYKLYKLLRICICSLKYDPPASSFSYPCTEILSFGGKDPISRQELSWKRIVSPPKDFLQVVLHQSCVCYNGVLYWYKERYDTRISDEGIRAFDLFEERFFSIPNPQSFMNHWDSLHYRQLLSFGPGLSIYAVKEENCRILSYQGAGNGGGGANLLLAAASTEMNFEFPMGDFEVIGLLPNGKVLVCHEKGGGLFYDIYNPSKRAWEIENIEIANCRHSINIYTFIAEQASYYEENILPLKYLIPLK